MKNGLKGFGKSEVKRITKGTEGLNGTFTITVDNEDFLMKYDEHPDHVKANISKLTSINSEKITVTRHNSCQWGCRWRIAFHGVKSKPVIVQKNLATLTKDANVSVTFKVTEI